MLSDDQIEFMVSAAAAGAVCTVAESIDDIDRAINDSMCAWGERYERARSRFLQLHTGLKL